LGNNRRSTSLGCETWRFLLLLPFALIRDLLTLQPRFISFVHRHILGNLIDNRRAVVQRILIVLLNQTVDLCMHFVNEIRDLGVDFLGLDFGFFRWDSDLLLELLMGF